MLLHSHAADSGRARMDPDQAPSHPIGAKGKGHSALEPRLEVAGSQAEKGEAAVLCSWGLTGQPPTNPGQGPWSHHLATGTHSSVRCEQGSGIASTFFHTINTGSVPWALQTWGVGSLPVGALPGHCGDERHPWPRPLKSRAPM